METLCPLGGAEMLTEPGPRPVRARRYEEVAFCNTSRFVLVHSWTNGVTPEPLVGLPTLQLNLPSGAVLRQ